MALQSFGGGRRDPRSERIASKEAKCWAGGQVRLGIERVVDGSMGGKESLGGSLRFELHLFSLASPNGQMRVLRPIVADHASWSMAPRNTQLSRLP